MLFLFFRRESCAAIELSDVRKLKLQQILQMLTCERDTEQVASRSQNIKVQT